MTSSRGERKAFYVTQFTHKCALALGPRGTLAMLVPSSLLSKGAKKDWRKGILEKNTLKAVIKLPDDLFEPFASSYADILFLEKGVPHNQKRDVFFAHVRDDGFKVKKGARTKLGTGDLPAVLRSFRTKIGTEGLCAFVPLEESKNGGLWGPGYYVPVATPSFEGLKDDVESLVRGQAAFQVAFADKLVAFQVAIDEGRYQPLSYQELYPNRTPTNSKVKNSLGDLFDIYYGQKELHSKDGLVDGDAMVVSSKGVDNGCYGFFNFDKLIKPPFITAPSTGTIGQASVQLWPCGVTDDCLLLFPKPGTAPEELWIAAAVIRRERWRFHYGYKLTPDRIKNYTVPRSKTSIATIQGYLHASMPPMQRLVQSLATFSAPSAGYGFAEFGELAKVWIDSTKHISNIARKCSHPAYQRIIGMGPSVVPVILRHMQENGPNDWFWALSAITGENPITTEMSGNMQDMSEAWIQWGTRMGYLTGSSRNSKDNSQTSRTIK